MMNEKLLKELYRYNPEEESYNVDIELNDYRDVYSEWDYSPFINRDLDEDLLEYLMECSLEISGKHRMIVNFFLPEFLYDKQREERSREGIRHYFSYRERKTKNGRWTLIRNSIILGLIGTFFLITSYFIEFYIQEMVALKLLSEGLMIGAWVAIWEIFSIVFFQVNEINTKLKHYKILKDLPIMYYYK